MARTGRTRGAHGARTWLLFADLHRPHPRYSLAISSKEDGGGSRLTHDHQRQYHFVLQSLTLWRDIANDMFMLWMECEADLLDAATPYEQTDTGQGWHRLQQCPRTRKAMHRLL